MKARIVGLFPLSGLEGLIDPFAFEHCPQHLGILDLLDRNLLQIAIQQYQISTLAYADRACPITLAALSV